MDKGEYYNTGDYEDDSTVCIKHRGNPQALGHRRLRQLRMHSEC